MTSRFRRIGQIMSCSIKHCRLDDSHRLDLVPSGPHAYGIRTTQAPVPSANLAMVYIM